METNCSQLAIIPGQAANSALTTPEKQATVNYSKLESNSLQNSSYQEHQFREDEQPSYCEMSPSENFPDNRLTENSDLSISSRNNSTSAVKNHDNSSYNQVSCTVTRSNETNRNSSLPIISQNTNMLDDKNISPIRKYARTENCIEVIPKDYARIGISDSVRSIETGISDAGRSVNSHKNEYQTSDTNARNASSKLNCDAENSISTDMSHLNSIRRPFTAGERKWFPG